MFGENADVPASSTSSSVPLPPRSPPLRPFVLSSRSLFRVFCLMFLTPFNLNWAHLSSTLHSLFAFGLTLRTDLLPLSLSQVPCHCCAATRPSRRMDNRPNRRGDAAHTIGGALWEGIVVRNTGTVQPVCSSSSVSEPLSII